MTSDEWNAVNSLVVLLSALDIPTIITEYYRRHNNPAPPLVLRDHIDRVQSILDAAIDPPSPVSPE